MVYLTHFLSSPQPSLQLYNSQGFMITHRCFSLESLHQQGEVCLLQACLLKGYIPAFLLTADVF